MQKFFLAEYRPRHLRQSSHKNQPPRLICNESNQKIDC